jgi:hypothetical protein
MKSYHIRGLPAESIRVAVARRVWRLQSRGERERGPDLAMAAMRWGRGTEAPFCSGVGGEKVHSGAGGEETSGGSSTEGEEALWKHASREIHRQAEAHGSGEICSEIFWLGGVEAIKPRSDG